MAGSSFLVLRAVSAWKPATPSGVMVDSVPPQTQASITPCLIFLKASPMAWVPEAQAETTQWEGPLRPNLMATLPAAILTMTLGIIKGETFSGPPLLRRRVSDSIRPRLPIPEPMKVPMFSQFSSVISRPDIAMASPAATQANWENLSSLFASFLSRWSLATKSFTSPAIRTGNSEASNCLIVSIPETPFLRLFQVSSTLFPTGVMAPTPVITTLWLILIISLISSQCAESMMQYTKRLNTDKPPDGVAYDCKIILCFGQLTTCTSRR